jgi:predicted AAA+ superfamily ATPase
MDIDIDITGPRAAGKTHLARRLRAFLAEELLPGQRGCITIRTRCPRERWVTEE